MEEFVEEVVSAGSARGPVNEDAEDGTVARGDRIEEDFVDGEGQIREMPQSVSDKLDAIIAARTPAAPAVEEEAPAEPETPAEGDPPAEEDPPLAADSEWQTKATALEQANAALAAEVEALKARAPQAPAPHKLLTEAVDGYLDDPIASARRMIAASLGIDDPADKRVDDELADFYTDLTAKVLGVNPDDKHLAKRNAARALHLVAREKRERTAEKQTTAEQAQAKADAEKAANAAQFIGNRLTVKNGDSRSIAEDYPLLMSLAEDLDGAKPEAVLWKALEHGSKTGRIVLTADDDANIRAAAKLIENRYQALADKAAKARPQPTNPSTAKPNPPTTPSQAKTRAPAPARTLTTADASVAPATPPAKKQTQTTPKFKTKEEAKAYALRHLDD